MSIHFWGTLLFFMLVLGFAYLVWAKALKRGGVTKTVGQVIAIITVIIAVIMLIYSGLGKGTFCPMMKGKYMMKGKPMMMEKGMMRHHGGRGMEQE